LIETVTLLGERGIELRSLKENIDTTTPAGKLMFHIIGVMAEFGVMTFIRTIFSVLRHLPCKESIINE